jgi:spore coat protein U-like protein
MSDFHHCAGSFLRASRGKAVGIVATCALLTAAVIPAGATVKTTTFSVTATVLAACSISATNLAFGSYDASSAVPTDGTNTLNVTCTNGLAYAVAMDAGTATSATVAARSMVNGANKLNYGLFTAADHATTWGDGTLSTVTVSGTGDGTLHGLTVYGRIPISQSVTAGAYADTITAKITY